MNIKRGAKRVMQVYKTYTPTAKRLNQEKELQNRKVSNNTTLNKSPTNRSN